MDPLTIKMAAQIAVTLAKSRMLKHLIIGCVVAALLPLVAIIATPSILAAQVSSNLETQGSHGADISPGCLAGSVPASVKWNVEQATNARTIWMVAQQMKMGDQGAVVGIATAMQESTLIAVPYGDKAGPDSRGLFQQRGPWGSLADRMDPAKSAGLFYAALGKIAGWKSLPVTVAAQRVQISAFPDAYAKWEPDARALAGTLSGQPACTEQTSVGGGPVPADFDKQGNPRTVEQAIKWMQGNVPNGAPGERVLGSCERYMNLSFGIGGGYATALAHWNASGPREASATGSPPRGALVFWRTGNPAGHVALSLGNGIVASTDYNPKTHLYEAGTLGIGPIADIDQWGARLGFRAPSFAVGSGR